MIMNKRVKVIPITALVTIQTSDAQTPLHLSPYFLDDTIKSASVGGSAVAGLPAAGAASRRTHDADGGA